MAQKMDKLDKRFEEYITQVFPHTRITRVRSSWPDQINIDHFVQRFTEQKKYKLIEISPFDYNLIVVLQGLQEDGRRGMHILPLYGTPTWVLTTSDWTSCCTLRYHQRRHSSHPGCRVAPKVATFSGAVS